MIDDELVVFAPPPGALPTTDPRRLAEALVAADPRYECFEFEFEFATEKERRKHPRFEVFVEDGLELVIFDDRVEVEVPEDLADAEAELERVGRVIAMETGGWRVRPPDPPRPPLWKRLLGR